MRFAGWLREHFGTTPPVGFCLRTDHRERWLRLHSLPGSKRYAETDAEHREVRARAHAAAAELLPAGKPVWLVSDEPDAAVAHDFERVGPFEHPLLEVPQCVWAAQTTWPHPGFERLIDKVARDARRAVWFSVQRGAAFAPYDGGIDLIAESPERAEALRKVFPRAWFSPHASAL